MGDERKINPKDNRDFLSEAVRCCESKGNVNILIKKEHLIALYNAWMSEVTKGQKIREAISKIAKLSRDGKLPHPRDIPYILMGMEIPPAPVKPTEEKK